MFENFDKNWNSILGKEFRKLDDIVKQYILDCDADGLNYSPITETIMSFMFGDITPIKTFNLILKILANYDLIFLNEINNTYKANGKDYKNITTQLNIIKKLII